MHWADSTLPDMFWKNGGGPSSESPPFQVWSLLYQAKLAQVSDMAFDQCLGFRG